MTRISYIRHSGRSLVLGEGRILIVRAEGLEAPQISAIVAESPALGGYGDLSAQVGARKVTIQAAIDGQGVALGTTPLVRQLIKQGRLIAPLASAAVSLVAYWTGFMNPSLAILAGIAMGPASGVLHDKLLSPLFIEQVKKDIADVEKKV